jgi:hypothetical protein
MFTQRVTGEDFHLYIGKYASHSLRNLVVDNSIWLCPRGRAGRQRLVRTKFKFFKLAVGAEHATQSSNVFGDPNYGSKGHSSDHVWRYTIPQSFMHCFDLPYNSCVNLKFHPRGMALSVPRNLSSIDPKTREVLGFCRIH